MKLIALLILMAAGGASAEQQWINNITVNEYNMTWGYKEIFTGVDSVFYRTGIARELGNNDSFISAWELLKLDKEMRSRLKSAIDNEMDVRIKTLYLNMGINETSEINVIDIESSLSPGIIGDTNISEPVVNKYEVIYRWENSISNASTIWLLGEAGSPVTIVLPLGIDVTNTSGMSNVTKNTSDHTEVAGFFTQITKNRGEITLYLAKNASFEVKALNVTNVTSQAGENVVNTVEIASTIRDGSILGGGIVLILLIYVFKMRKKW